MRIRPSAIRLAVIIGLIVLWRWLAVAHPQAAGGMWDWARQSSDTTVYRGGWIALAILTFYVIAYSVILIRARHHGGPDAAMGYGCGLFALAILVVGWFILTAGMFFHIKWLVIVIGVMTIFSAILVVGGLIAEGAKAIQKWREP